MTEKRFKLSEPHGAYLVDIEDDEIVGHWDNDDDKIIDLLNSLNEENEQLKNHIQELQKHCKRLENENIQTYDLIKEAYNNERTQLGKSVLKQLLEAIQ